MKVRVAVQVGPWSEPQYILLYDLVASTVKAVACVLCSPREVLSIAGHRIGYRANGKTE